MARDFIKQLRLKRFPSQAALAEAAGIKTSRYSRIEKGYCDLTVNEAESLARVLNTSVSVIEGKSGDTVDSARAATLPSSSSIASTSSTRDSIGTKPAEVQPPLIKVAA